LGKAASPGVSVLLLTAALLEGGCVSTTAPTGSDRVPIGTVQVTSATFGNVTLAPASCASGEHQLFLGADFLDAARGATVRLILGPTGEATLRVFDTARPLDPGAVIPRSACSKAIVSFERTGWQINDIYDVRVSLDVDCRTASGETIQGKLAVAHCH
jgi:hypothetical protein